MKLIIFILLTTMISFNSFSQDVVSGTSFVHFKLKNGNDTINFVVADTNLTEKKPILLFCQGSLPVPLFVKIRNRKSNKFFIWPTALSNFDVEYLNKHFHTVVISMPHTPLVVKRSHLNKSFCYVTDTTKAHSFDIRYVRSDYAENYVQRANTVLKFLKKQPWVDNQKLVVAGHSQGARIAVGIAYSNENVTDLGLFGYDYRNRIGIGIRKARIQADAGIISWEKADSLIQEQYELAKMIKNDKVVKDQPGLIAWRSFSKGSLHKLLELKIPIYVAYGTEDIGAIPCDYLPLYFIEKGKQNLTLKRYPNLNHNFFPLDKNGKANHKQGKWVEVMNSFIKWTMK